MSELQELKELFYYKEGKLYNKISSGKAVKDEEAGSDTNDGYRRVTVKGKELPVHRVIYQLVSGKKILDSMYVDHIDGDRKNNRIRNLRLASPRENQHNKSVQQDSLSAYKGVWKDARTGKWRAAIRGPNVRYHLGYFDSEEEAAKAYDRAAKQIQGRFVEALAFVTNELCSKGKI